MTKADLIAEISKTTGVDRMETARVVESFMKIVKKSLVEGKHIELRGFGTFQVKKRAAKIARNIRKQESVLVPEKNIPVFKPSKKFTGLFEDYEKM